MKKMSGKRVDASVYSKMIRSCHRGGDLKECFVLAEEMIHRQPACTGSPSSTWKSLCTAVRTLGDSEDAFRAWKMMTTSKHYDPEPSVLFSFLNLFAEMGSTEGSTMVFDSFVLWVLESHLCFMGKPGPFSHNEDGVHECPRSEDCLQPDALKHSDERHWIEQMDPRHSAQLHALLAKSFALSGRHAEAKNVFDTGMQVWLKQRSSHNFASKVGFPSKELQEAGRVLFEGAFALCAWSGDQAMAAECFAAMMRVDVTLGKLGYRALLCTFVGQPKTQMMFWEEAQRKKLFPDVKEIVQMDVQAIRRGPGQGGNVPIKELVISVPFDERLATFAEVQMFLAALGGVLASMSSLERVHLKTIFLEDSLLNLGHRGTSDLLRTWFLEGGTRTLLSQSSNFPVSEDVDPDWSQAAGEPLEISVTGPSSQRLGSITLGKQRLAALQIWWSRVSKGPSRDEIDESISALGVPENG